MTDDGVMAATLFGARGPARRRAAARRPRARLGAGALRRRAASAAPTCIISVTAAPAISSSTSPLVLGHEIAGEVVEIGGRGARPRRRRPRRGQSVALVRALRALPRGPAEPVREHLLHGLGLRRRRTCRAASRPSSTRSPAQCVQVPDDVAVRGGRPGRAAGGLPARGRAGRARRRAGAAIVFGAGPIGLLTMLAARRAGAVGGRCRRHRGRRRSPSPTRSAPTTSSTSPAATGALEGAGGRARLRRRVRGLGHRRRPGRRPSAPSGAAAPWSRSATCRAARSPCRPMPSWPRRSTSRGSFRFGREFDEAVDLIVDGRSM